MSDTFTYGPDLTAGLIQRAGHYLRERNAALQLLQRLYDNAKTIRYGDTRRIYMQFGGNDYAALETFLYPDGNDPDKSAAACVWTVDETDGGHDTACGNKHLFIDGDAEGNGYKFCPYCGLAISTESEVK